MLSIGIPVYNTDVTELITTLAKQAEYLPWVEEIIVLDDASDISILSDQFNPPKVRRLRNEKNFGRSKTRNTIAMQAKGTWVLFIDGDSQVQDDSFLQRWVSYLENTSAMVVVGGSVYQNAVPVPEYYLRWRVSRIREQNTPSFKTNNVAIHASVFNHTTFNERLSGYGHEDTLFGFELQQKKMVIEQLPNPVLNKELDSNAAYLSKTEIGIKNLVVAQQRSSYPEQFIEYVRILRFYNLIKKFRMLFLINLVIFFLMTAIESRLRKGKKWGLVFAFDLYKLCLLHKELRGHQPN